jgi:glycosyltransferase involved in cell wall biosynthesis
LDLTIIIPTLNENANIQALIESILVIDDLTCEILVVDGGSDDGTIECIERYKKTNENIRLILNPERFVSQGFNKAFQEARGTYISLIGAHAVYPPNFFSTCIKAIESGACDVAGGYLLQQGKSPMGKAIAMAMSTRVGVGDTAFRTVRKRMYVDSVAFAVYHRRVFEVCGGLDEELIRNQDDEFHYRINRAGFRILMLPDLEVVYYVRESLERLFAQYFQYGYYKPLVIYKVRTGLRARHLIPSMFVLYLLSLPLALYSPIWLLPFLGYIFLGLYASLFTAAPASIRARMLMVFPVLHISYGAGFLNGIRLLLKKLIRT